jgi:phage baseplate assembly protein W
MSTYSEIAEARWGRDIVLPDCEAGVTPTATGDWPTVAGRANLHGAHRRRAVTTPGELLHRPEYGGGMMLWLEAPNSAGEQARLAASVRGNAFRDPRVEEVRVAVSTPEGRENQSLIELTIRPRGEIESETVTTVLEV